MTNIVVVPDVHLEPGTPYDPSYIAVKRFIADVKPTAIVLLGDFADMGCFNRHDIHGNKKLHLEGKRYWKSVAQVRNELYWFASHTSDLRYLLGNHEDWFYQYIIEHPELEDSMEWIRDCGARQLCTECVHYGEYTSVGKLNFTHGWKVNKYHAEATAREFGDHIFYAHTHDHQEFTPHFRKDQLPYAAVSCGCLCSRNPSYMKKTLASRWINGFVYVEVKEDGNFNHHWLAITDGEFTFAGDTWHGRVG